MYFFEQTMNSVVIVLHNQTKLKTFYLVNKIALFNEIQIRYWWHCISLLLKLEYVASNVHITGRRLLTYA